MKTSTGKLTRTRNKLIICEKILNFENIIFNIPKTTKSITFRIIKIYN